MNDQDQARLSVARIRSARGENVIEKDKMPVSQYIWAILFIIFAGLAIGTFVYLAVDAAYSTYVGSCHTWSLECIRVWTGWW